MSAIKHLDQRVAVFIDSQNLYHTAKHVYNNSKVHFGRVVEAAVAGRNLVRAIAYVISTESGDEYNFFEALGKSGIEIKTKDLQVFIDGSKKADWDVAMSIDAIRISQKVDCVIIVSGDGDFVPLLQYLKQSGVQTEVVSFGKSVSANLREEADIFMDLSEDLDLFLIGNHYRKSPQPSLNKVGVLHQNVNNNFNKSKTKTIKVAHVDTKSVEKEIEQFLKEENDNKKVVISNTENKENGVIVKQKTKEEIFREKLQAPRRDNFRKK